MISNKVVELIEPLIGSMGYTLWGCQYLAHKQSAILRIYIDKPEGIALADCELVSKAVSACLDVEDLITNHYNLEISSPGVPRPLFYMQQYAHYQGHEIEVKLYHAVMGKKKIIGIIHSVSENGVVLRIDNININILFSQIVKANLMGE